MNAHHHPQYPYLNSEDFNRFQEKYTSLQPYPKAQYAETEICARHTMNRIIQIDDRETLEIMLDNGASMYTRFSTGASFLEEASRGRAYKVMDCLYERNYDKEATLRNAIWGHTKLAEKIIDGMTDKKDIHNTIEMVLENYYNECVPLFQKLLNKLTEEEIVSDLFDKKTSGHLLEFILGTYSTHRSYKTNAISEQCVLMVFDRATSPQTYKELLNQIKTAEDKYPGVLEEDEEDEPSKYLKFRDNLLKKAKLLSITVEKKYLEKTLESSPLNENVSPVKKDIFRI